MSQYNPDEISGKGLLYGHYITLREDFFMLHVTKEEILDGKFILEDKYATSSP